MTQPIVYNLGSLNIDRVFRVAHIVAPGETLASRSLAQFAGGKGANQSVALARAGARVEHIGKVGADGLWLRDRLAAEGIGVRHVTTADVPTGQAIIQVDDAGQNAIVLLSGANAEITADEIDAALADAPAGSWLLVQNETSGVAHAIVAAKRLGLHVALNPAPCDERAAGYPLELVDLLCVNETEAALLQDGSVRPAGDVLLTLGPRGARLVTAAGESEVPASPVTPLDTTAAGDTFLGYYLAALVQGLPPADRLALATRAAGLCVTRAGAMDSIPRRKEVDG